MPGGRSGGVFSLDLVDERPGLIVFQATGHGAQAAFAHEAGGHRYQRVPPNEKRGRVHTSTVTLACLPVPTETEVHLNDRDLEWQATRGSGAGGQARNKVSSAVILKHKPSGITVRVENERSQHQNLATAKDLLRARLYEAKHAAVKGARDSQRRAQLGSGQRGDKVRTIAMQRGQVVDHRTGKRMSVERYMKGDLSPLY